MSPFQEDRLLVQLRRLSFVVFYALWPSWVASAWCDLKRVLIKYTEVILVPNGGRRNIVNIHCLSVNSTLHS